MIKDALDTVLISNVNWKVGTFSFLPIAFGVAMALVDVVMMFTAKFVHLGRLPYAPGLALATGVYLLQPYLFIKALNYETLSAMNLIWNLASNIVVTVSGVLVFRESVHGLRWVAIAMSLFAIGLFSYTGTSD
jgi:multidrug transporter EmrE-like cation transporter